MLPSNIKIHPACAYSYQPAKVEEYRKLLRDGKLPPPVVYHREMLLDGRHRLEAWLAEGRDEEDIPRTQYHGADPAVEVARLHLGARRLNSLAAMTEEVRLQIAQGSSRADAVARAPKKYRNLIEIGLDKLAGKSAKAPEPAAPRPKAVKESVRVVIPDSHGEHIDLPARDAFLEDLKSLNPSEIVMLGDHLDAGGTFSAHQRSFTHEKTETYEADVIACNIFLDLIQKSAPKAKIYYIEGNHEQHVDRWAARMFEAHKDAKMALDAIGPKAVLKLEKRGIEYFDRSTMYMGLPIQGAIKLGKCHFVHGISHSKHTAAAHLARFGQSVIFGHVHRAQAIVERTVSAAGILAACPGTLAKLQPLYRHTAPTDWSHGYGLQLVHPNGNFCHFNIPILDGVSFLPAKLRY